MDQSKRACSMWRLALGAGLLLVGMGQSTRAEDNEQLGTVSPEVLSKSRQTDARGMIERDIHRRADEANARNRAEWAAITTREQWEQYRDPRIDRLRRSLGAFPAPPAPLPVRVTGTVEGDGFRIENTLFETRPGQWVTGNLYVPARPGQSMPGILIAHAHHGGKLDRELQDMGMTWARTGCVVLVIDQVGYGERRAHPFNREEDYPQPYRTGRQDYFFRQDSGIQLQLLGDSLMGWMAWDLMRGVDLLLARDGIDPQRIIILGAVAGGGDPAGVTAALDRRIACCVPFNFGGPQPETRYPLPADAETSFNYLGGSYWESTRGLRLGGRDGFFHWLIVASTAPRRLIHAHEFSWDGERDPVWKRYQKIWGEFYQAPDNIGVAHGKGLLSGRPPEASHCNNIGAFHRRMIHPLFERWFGIKVSEQDEYSAGRNRAELLCLTDKAREDLHPQSLLEVMSAVGQARIAAARARSAGKSPAERRKLMQDDWSRLLGNVTPAQAPVIQVQAADDERVAGAKIERVVLEVEPGIIVPLIVLVPAELTARGPVVVGLSKAGKAGFLKGWPEELHKLIQAGTIVVLPDLRGTGETRAGDTDLSVNLQLFGETLLGERVRDLRSVLAYVRGRKDVDAGRLALWGESFTPPNPADTNYKVPRGVEAWPQGPDPLGGLLALCGGLFEDDVRAVYVAGGLAGYHNVLTHFAVLIPHGDCVPGALTAGDLCDLAGSLAPRRLRLEALIDHRNLPVPVDKLQAAYEPTTQSYSTTPQAFSLAATRSSVSAWLVEQLK